MALIFCVAFTGTRNWRLRVAALVQNGRGEILDSTNHCYGLAFVLLAYAHATRAGLTEAAVYVSETFDLMEQRFWSGQHGLYADEASADWKTLSPYRGQNANMHSCEALIAAFEASGDRRYLARAMTSLATSRCARRHSREA